MRLKREMKEEIESLGLPERPKKYLTVYFLFRRDFMEKYTVKEGEKMDVGKVAKMVGE